MPRPANNPFTPDQPIVDDERFFGREETMDWAQEHLVTGQHFLLLYGTARMGKTSLLYRLRSRLALRAFPVYCDLESLPQSQTSAALWRIAEETHRALASEHAAVPPPDRQTLEKQEDYFQQQLLPAWRPFLRGKALLLLLDGLDWEPVSQGAWADLLQRMQRWLSQEPDLWVVAAVRGASTAAREVIPVLRGLPARDLEPLTEAQVEELMVGLARYQLGFDYDALRRIHNLTGGHPYLIHLFGSELYYSLAPYGQVTIHTVSDLVGSVVSLASSLFEREWAALSREAQLVLAALGSLHGYRGTVTPSDLVVHLRRHGVHRSNEGMEQALRELVKRRIMHWYGASAYALRVELWRNWLAANHTLEEVLHGKRAHRAPRQPRRMDVPWSSLALWLGIGVGILLVIKVWNERNAAAPTRVIPPTFTSGPVTPRPTATRVVLPGRIAYQAQNEASAPWCIWTMRDNGTDPQRLTDGTSEDTQPVWSPDGSRMAIISTRSGNRDVWAIGADGMHATNITNSGADEWTPAWSPDGSAIAFSSNREGNWELYIAKIDGSETRRITWSAAPDYMPTWSRDGSRLAFVSERDGNPEIYIVSSDGTDLQRLTENQVTDLAPQWSPDGSTIAFESYRDGNMEIYIMAPDGSAVRNLSNEPGSDEHGPAWSPDGRWLAYYSNRDSSWDIFVMRADGTEKTNLTMSAAVEQAPAWQPRTQ